MPEIRIEYRTVTLQELALPDQQLVAAAEAALEGAHAPYSHFHVASALRDETGKITIGNNQENAAYPSGLCAERVALFSAKSVSKVPIEALVVMARSEAGEWADAYPCGSCRQVMLEYASQQQQPLKVIMKAADGLYHELADARMLLPFYFDAAKLK